MFVPIEDVKKVKCPHLSHNNTFLPCIGNECMAWRWYNTAYGYCGRSGKPERDIDFRGVKLAEYYKHC